LEEIKKKLKPIKNMNGKGEKRPYFSLPWISKFAGKSIMFDLDIKN
jgi:hypothetical protein